MDVSTLFLCKLSVEGPCCALLCLVGLPYGSGSPWMGHYSLQFTLPIICSGLQAHPGTLFAKDAHTQSWR